jgi:hypothetical protein
MDSSENDAYRRVDANLRAECGTAGRSGSISVITASDGTLTIETTGMMPSVTLGQLRKVRQTLQSFVQATEQAIFVKYNGNRLVSVQPRSTQSLKWSIQWWSLFRYWVGRRTASETHRELC